MLRRVSSPLAATLLAATLLAGTLLMALGSTASAQPAAGDAVVVTANQVLDVTPNGTVTTLANLPTGHVGLGLCAAFGNRGVAVLTRRASPRANTLFLLNLTAGVWRTLGSQANAGALTVGAQGGVERDQRGDYIVATPNGLLRVAGTGGAIQLVSKGMTTGVADHLRAGGWLAFTGGRLVHVTRQGALTTLGSPPGPTILGAGGVFADTFTGDAYFAFNALYRFNLATSSFTTMRVSGIGNIRCGDLDPAGRTLVVGTTTGVYRVSRQGFLLGTFAQLPTTAVGVAVHGSSQVAVFGPFNPGTTSTVHVSFPTDAGQFYQLGASSGFRPGIATRVDVIPLNPDALFGLVFAAPALFRNFGGQLDAGGTGAARIALPKIAALVGFRFFVAGLTYNSGGRILSISEPVGVEIE